MTRLDIPEAIAAYFDADKRDPEVVASCFTSRGVVKDEGKKHAGRTAIKKWKAAASAKYSYTSEPIAVERSDGRYIVTSRLTGNFPGSPIDLRYAFRLERGKIASLEITA
ncbi:MAG TPA: nuclear transport factor 2 family protein [Gammaproteobacteria bacterium]|nr:nuclear transport factor 2 family protein [Gammaproteobacteria bacterium]